MSLCLAKFSMVGHYHRGMVKSVDKHEYFYPGSPEPLGFGEKNSHTVGLLKIDKSGIKLETVPINIFRFVSTEINVSAATTREQIKTELENRIKSEVDKNTFLNVTLVGELASELDLEMDVLVEKLNEYCAFGILTDSTRSGFDLESISDDKTVRGKFVQTMQAKINQAEKKEKSQLEQALIYGLMAFDGRDLVNL